MPKARGRRRGRSFRRAEQTEKSSTRERSARASVTPPLSADAARLPQVLGDFDRRHALGYAQSGAARKVPLTGPPVLSRLPARRAVMLNKPALFVVSIVLPGCLANVVALEPKAESVKVVHESDKPLRCDVLG